MVTRAREGNELFSRVFVSHEWKMKCISMKMHPEGSREKCDTRALSQAAAAAESFQI